MTFYDGTDVNPETSLVPDGTETILQIRSVGRKDFQTEGYAMDLEFKVAEGAYRNRKIWDFHPISHSSTVFVEIGRRMLKQLCLAAGADPKLDSVQEAARQLAGKKIRAVIAVDKGNERFPPRNRIKRYIYKDSGQAAPGAAPSTQSDADRAEGDETAVDYSQIPF